MRLIFVRHGDPDYSIDSLTEKGWREAELLGEYMKNIPARDYYVSPLGRAKDTASFTLKNVGREAEVCDWLQEFHPVPIRRPDVEGKTIIWDWLPKDWMPREHFFDKDLWKCDERFLEAGVGDYAEKVWQELDVLLEKYGYRRDGYFYRTEQGNNDTIVFFCHFGVTALLLAHLLNISPMILWQATCACPTSLTEVVTEERTKGIASWRMLTFGAAPHFVESGEQPAFAARFRECYENDWERG